MNNTVPLARRLMIGIGAIAWFVLACLFLLAIPVVFQLPIWVFGLVVLAAATPDGIRTHDSQIPRLMPTPLHLLPDFSS